MTHGSKPESVSHPKAVKMKIKSKDGVCCQAVHLVESSAAGWMCGAIYRCWAGGPRARVRGAYTGACQSHSLSFAHHKAEVGG